MIVITDNAINTILSMILINITIITMIIVITPPARLPVVVAIMTNYTRL